MEETAASNAEIVEVACAKWWRAYHPEAT